MLTEIDGMADVSAIADVHEASSVRPSLLSTLLLMWWKFSEISKFSLKSAPTLLRGAGFTPRRRS
jgi:hypothetical protein